MLCFSLKFKNVPVKNFRLFQNFYIFLRITKFFPISKFVHNFSLTYTFFSNSNNIFSYINFQIQKFSFTSNFLKLTFFSKLKNFFHIKFFILFSENSKIFNRKILYNFFQIQKFPPISNFLYPFLDSRHFNFFTFFSNSKIFFHMEFYTLFMSDSQIFFFLNSLPYQYNFENFLRIQKSYQIFYTYFFFQIKNFSSISNFSYFFRNSKIVYCEILYNFFQIQKFLP